MDGKCRMAGRFREEKTGADLIVLCADDAGHQGEHGDGHGRTWPQTPAVSERAASDLDLDAIRQGVAHLHRTRGCPAVERLADVDIPALLAEVENLRAERDQAADQRTTTIVEWLREHAGDTNCLDDCELITEYAGMIERGEYLAVGDPPQPAAIDLMAALKASVDRAKARRSGAAASDG